ncbi:hypothetical protein SEA_JUMBO_1 [Gordonia phage Jumbo]|uniref:Zinc finger CHC2-type domain-containing protein n=1 Tax=Gordonia phage Jumbo TaxID=1887650 RepID=A0A1B3B0H7_9CAUD|nr:helicase [Gordonia phage Jumbo]AOE44515.1 hypothetical protein SEA_JUMBO_1 [Gordonia phage Jumbo]
MTDPSDGRRFTALTPRSDQQKQPEPASAGTAALAGGTTLAQFKGNAGTTQKDGAKEELKGIDLLKVYGRLFPGKTVLNTRGTETQVSCFNENGHSNGDRNPSMSINTATNVFKCFGCEAGGDIFNLIAYKQGYARADTSCPADKLHQAVYDANKLLNLGWEFHQASDGNWYRTQDHQKNRSKTNVVQFPAGFAAEEPVVQGAHRDSENPYDFGIESPEDMFVPELPWRDFLDNGTGMREYLELVSQDDIAEEYHFWNFMVLLGLLIGRDVTFADSPPVHGNIFVCLNGATSAGKSRSMGYIKRLMAHDDIKFDKDDPFTDGIKRVVQPGSGEVLTKSFIHESDDPASSVPPALTPGVKAPRVQKKKVVHPVRGLIEFEELSALITKADNKGSTIKTTLIEIYDCGMTVGGSSLSHGSYEADLPFGSVLSSVQPEVLETLFSGTNDAASGFLNRWLFIPGNHKKRQALIKPIDLDPIVPYLVDIRTWASDMKTHNGGTVEFARVNERDRFLAFCDQYIFPKEHINGLQRVHLLYKKLTLLACALYKTDHITDQALDLAERLVQWIVDVNGGQSIAALAESSDERHQKAIMKNIVKSGREGITPSVLKQRVSQSLGATYSVRDYDFLLKSLVRDDVILHYERIKLGRGRPLDRFVDPVHYDFWEEKIQQAQLKNN